MLTNTSFVAQILWVPWLTGGPFRFLAEECRVIEFKPSWLYDFGYYLKPILYLRNDIPRDVRVHILTYARIGLILFTSDDKYAQLLPQATRTAKMLMDQIDIWLGLKVDEFGPRTDKDIPGLHDWVKTLSTKLESDLGRLHVYCVTERGNLAINQLVEGASSGYSSDTTKLFDDSIRREVDEGGRCLAFGRWTASGFHILRSVEIIVKGYLIAATGSLPPMNRRNWGEYIERMTKASASQEVTDELYALKRKRNPLMHPQDNLEMDEAIDVFNACRTAANALTKEIRARSLEAQFAAALVALPTM